jgi:diphthine synthase
MIMSELPEERARKYVVSIEKVLSKMEFTQISSVPDEKRIRHLVDSVHSYVDDAKHYLEDRPSTALAAISYAEGLLDALRLLGMVRFTWPDQRDDAP